MRKLNVLVAGSTGYIGIQLIKLLLKHKYLKIKYLCGNNSAGKKIYNFDKSLRNAKLPKILKFNKKFLINTDVIFTALPNGEAQKISKNLGKKNILIDLAADFRLKKSSVYLKWYKLKHNAINKIKESIYSLPEITKSEVKNFNIISCPGCYPTSILLPLIPLVKKKLIKVNNIIIDSKSGYSGAGRGVHKRYKNRNLYESISAYGIASHRHNPEIEEMLKKYTKKRINIYFTPHLTPMFRGILSTIYIDVNDGANYSKILSCLTKQYSNEPFVKVFRGNKLLSTNDVINTNNCFISVNKSRDNKKIIILSVIDNLIKGGAGQAIQNLNLKFGFPIKMGLK